MFSEDPGGGSDETPAEHLERRPGSLTEPDVGDNSGERSYHESRLRSEVTCCKGDYRGNRLEKWNRRDGESGQHEEIVGGADEVQEVFGDGQR